MLLTDLLVSQVPAPYREAVRFCLEQSRIQEKPGRKRDPRDKHGATPGLAKKCDAYEKYWNLLDAKVTEAEAAREARAIYGKFTDESWLKLITSRDERANDVLRKRGTLRTKR
ncbi:hypothetical protein [Bradyrhizobium sp. DOA1]|uniref:hypothetical protein n=1 Tax=Bradyrhizobium sp. DOA1 TaxID=1126616 RepID=UPI0012E9208C|nr:hypothetical protein [Bradyrhizobium sp. DOA1]